MSFEIPLHRARRYIAHTLRQTQRQIKRVARGKIKSVSQSRHFLQANKTFSFPYEVLCHCERKYGDPAGYFVPVGKRNKQAKDKQLSFTAIVWSKVKFMTRSVRRCHIDIHHCQLLRLSKKLIFKKIFKKFELNKTKNGGFPKSDFPFLPENTSVLTKRRRFCIIKL